MSGITKVILDFVEDQFQCVNGHSLIARVETSKNVHLQLEITNKINVRKDGVDAVITRITGGPIQEIHWFPIPSIYMDSVDAYVDIPIVNFTASELLEG